MVNNDKKKVLIVFGTRPEAIKMAPVVKAFGKSNDFFDSVVCATAQHREMLDQVLSIFEIKPDIDLNLMAPNQTLQSLTAKTIEKMSEVMERVKPDVTLVQGDTTTAMVSGLASFYAKVPVGHVEAGLRTDERYDPFPEEINRRLLSTLTTFHFAPTQKAVESLLQEGFNSENIYKTGNTVIDALLITASKDRKISLDVDITKKRYILVTAHRRENFGKPIKRICDAFKSIVKRNNDIEIVYPVHLNPNIKKPVHEILGNESRIHLISPLEYEDFVYYMKNAHIIITDSGGVQEEAPSLGKPVLVIRETTERPEAVEAGVAKLVGTDTDDIVRETEFLLNDVDEYHRMAHSVNPFGDGKASEKIVQIVKRNLFS